MHNIGYKIFSFFVFVGLVALGYLAISTLESGEEYVAVADDPRVVAQREPDPVDVNQILQESLEQEQAEAEQQEQEQDESDLTFNVDTHAELIARLQVLKDRGVYLKSGNQGSAVKAIQDFLLVHNPDSGVIADQDFGPGTKRAVVAFQQSQSLDADGIVGPGSIQVMIDILSGN